MNKTKDPAYVKAFYDWIEFFAEENGLSEWAVDELNAVIVELIEIVEKTADQQAMTDDSWKEQLTLAFMIDTE